MVSPGRVCARCTLWTTLSPSPWDVTWSPFRNLTFPKRRTTPASPFDGRSHIPTGGMILPSPPPTHGLPPSTPFLTSTPPPPTPPHPKHGTEAWPSPTPSLLQPPLSAQAHYPTPPFMPPPGPPLDVNSPPPPVPTVSWAA